MPLPVDRVDVGEHDVAVRQLGDDQLFCLAARQSAE